MQQKSIHLNSTDDTLRLGSFIGSFLEGRLVVSLIGNLGAGKTTFTQGLASCLKVEEAVNSPTFLMMNEYHSGTIPLYHFDLYRLQEDLDLESSATFNLKQELDEIMQSTKALVVVVEWLDLWEEFCDGYDQIRIEIKYASDGGREALLSAKGNVAEKVLERCQEKSGQ